MTKRYRPGDRLRRYSLFKGCSRTELARADQLFTHLRFPAGRHFIREGDAGVELFLIWAGEITVRRGHEALVHVGPGDLVGEVALVDGSLRNADVFAVGSVDVLVQGVRELETLLRLAPVVGDRLEELARKRRLAEA